MICLSLGGDLVIIRSQDENNFARDLVRNQQTDQAFGAWLGLYRRTDNAFYWIDGTPLAGQYSAWASGEPNNHNSNGEGCAHMYASNPWGRTPGEWNDIACDLSKATSTKTFVALCQEKYT